MPDFLNTYSDDPGVSVSDTPYVYHRSSEIPDDDVFGVLFDLLEQVVTGPEWHKRAACKGKDPEIFFPERGFPTSPAKLVCFNCEVRQECAAAGLDEHFGIWGMTTERERRRMRRVRNAQEGRGPKGQIRPKCGTPAGYKAHLARDEHPCDPCREAHRIATARRRAS